MALLEVCCGSPESVAAAVAGGARRIELCAHLELDGLTPPTEWVREAKTRYPDLLVHVLIRPRAGDFVYAAEEADTMILQIREALEAGADGIVIGALTPAGDVDLALLKRLISVIPAGQAGITFHRAFDVCRKPFDALEQIIGQGCDRILTSGQQPTAAEGADMLCALRQRARGRILILPGGGVTPDNAARILTRTGCVEIHASASETLDGKKITSAAKVAAILQAISAC
jgi:copper homeostasis protein